MVLLHGTLDAWILEGKNLEVAYYGCMPRLRADCRACVHPGLKHSAANGASGKDHKVGSRSIYVVLNAGTARLAGTEEVNDHDNHPVWDERFKIYMAHDVSTLDFLVKDDNAVGAEKLGLARVPADSLLGGQAIEEWLPLVDKSGKQVKGGGQLRVRLQFLSVQQDEAYRKGPGPVPYTYFLMRKMCRITAYQDAHCPPGLLPVIRCPDTGTERNAGMTSAWHDIFTAVRNARRLIYIASWCFTHDTKVNVPSEDGANKATEGPTIGELLKQKAEEGVRVNIILWDVVSSKLARNPLAATKAVDLTHNGAAVDFFRGSKVVCVLAPRDPSNMSSIKGALSRRIGYTLHHKIFLVDGDGSGHVAEKRRLLAFIGGLDPTDHDYDTPAHSLYSWRKDKYEPWHDAECRIEGPAAWDVFTHVEQEWRKLASDHVNALLPISEVPDLIHPPDWSHADPEWKEDTCPELGVTDASQRDTWHVQVFQSVDTASYEGLPEDKIEAYDKGLGRHKGVVVDRGIANSYVHAIRRAQKFLYVENQYFVGSSYAWPRYKHAEADNVVPMEIALKVAQKIDAGERFGAYILVPLHPEIYGPQADAMLYWQRLTMQAMYTVVAEALARNGLQGRQHPQDYLNFYCLGNRQDTIGPHGEPAKPPKKKNKPRRSFIHVHAKVLLQDDETLNIGSANLNERSLNGARDTEIAMGAFQPHAVMQARGSSNSGVKTPRGDVYGYRMSVWAEHFGGNLDPVFDDPGSLECVQLVNQRAQRNWDTYKDSKPGNMEGHIMPYPIQVGMDGSVEDLPGWKKFPGEKGKVKGNTRGPAWFSTFTT